MPDPNAPPERAADDPQMTIGTFARASLLSVRALRNYHDRGLLLPASVDPATGYRTYRASQLPDAAIIRRLRDLDVSLEDVGEIMRARDPEVTRTVIAEHERTMRDRLADLEEIVAELQRSAELPTVHTPVHVRDEPAVSAIVMSGTVRNGAYEAFLHDAYPRIFDAITSSGAVATASGSALYPATKDDVELIHAYVPIESTTVLSDRVAASGVRVDVIPSATCAVATHVGGYRRISETYSQLGAWVVRHAVPLESPVREHYVVSVGADGQLLPDDELRTEIAWPVAPASESDQREKRAR